MILFVRRCATKTPTIGLVVTTAGTYRKVAGTLSGPVPLSQDPEYTTVHREFTTAVREARGELSPL